VVARPRSRYQELPPPAPLRPYVECLWAQVVGDGDGTYAQPVLPDGRIDVVAVGDRLVVAGPATHTTTLTLTPRTVTVGVRFRIGAAPAVIGESAAGLRDLEIPLDAVLGSVAAETRERLAHTSAWRDRLDVIVESLLGRLDRVRALDEVVANAAAILEDDPNPRITRVADEVGLSERQLRRRVEETVGYSPRTLARILRFQRFLRAARTPPTADGLAVLAAGAGYADQAHLTRESRDLTGLSPAMLLNWEVERLGA
jgi:AraC-like DNA-binding protein